MPGPGRTRSHRLRGPSAFFALAIAIGLAAPSYAQDGAADKGGVGSLIERGRAQFDDLRYEESIQTLSAALLRPGTSKEHKIEVYRLLAYNYITINRFEEADAAVRGILVIDPEFDLPDTESPRFRDFFDETKEKWDKEGRPGLEEATDTSKAQAAVRILHTSPARAEAGTVIKLTGKVEDPGGLVHSVELFYRAGSQAKFAQKALPYSMGAFRGQIPQASIQPPLVEYYLQAADAGGLPLASRGDADAPLRVSVPDDSGGGVFTSPWFWIPVGALVVGGAILTAVVATSGDDPDPGSRTSTVLINVGE